MLVVHIEHDGNTTGKQYVFNADYTYYPLLKVGSRVICDTRFGYASGIVKSISDEEKSSATKDIVAVVKNVKLWDICVPDKILNSKPSLDKLEAKRTELVNGGFSSPIVISSSELLLDGYINVIVADERSVKRVDAVVVGNNKKAQKISKWAKKSGFKVGVYYD